MFSPPSPTRRELLGALVGLCAGSAAVLSACKNRPPPLTQIPAQALVDPYARGALAEVEALMPGGEHVEIVDLTFHDWAYPYLDRVEATQDTPAIWRTVCTRDPQGLDEFHGIKLRLPGTHDGDALHRSGPKLIAFLPSSDSVGVSLLKRAYTQGFSLAVEVSWIGVLRSGVWGESQVQEDDMVGLQLHRVRTI